MTENLIAPPSVVSAHLTAHTARDVEGVLRTLAPDAVVVDDGRTHRGADEIAGWLQRGASEYSYSSTLTGVDGRDDAHWVVSQRLEGDFPGGVVDLRFRFTLRDGLIEELTIAP